MELPTSESRRSPADYIHLGVSASVVTRIVIVLGNVVSLKEHGCGKGSDGVGER